MFWKIQPTPLGGVKRKVPIATSIWADFPQIPPPFCAPPFATAHLLRLGDTSHFGGVALGAWVSFDEKSATFRRLREMVSLVYL